MIACLGEESASRFEVIANYACRIGENPLWHPIEQRLYWTDIPAGRLFCFDPTNGWHGQVYEGRPVGGFTFQADGPLLLFRDGGSIALWRDGEIDELIPELPQESDSRFNDVIADPVGRVFCGTTSTPHRPGRLYRLNLDGSITVVLEEIGCSNGMGFTPDRRGFYHTDSFAGAVCLFDYQVDDGSLSNCRLFATIPKSEGLPDGLTVDADGCVMLAVWGGSSIIRFAPSGERIEELEVPARKVSSLSFGGADLRDIYITTAGGDTKEDNGELAGALLRFRSKTRGVPEFASRIQPPSR